MHSQFSPQNRFFQKNTIASTIIVFSSVNPPSACLYQWKIEIPRGIGSARANRIGKQCGKVTFRAQNLGNCRRPGSSNPALFNKKRIGDERLVKRISPDGPPDLDLCSRRTPRYAKCDIRSRYFSNLRICPRRNSGAGTESRDADKPILGIG